MSTVQSNILRFLQRVDPKRKDMTVITSSNINEASVGWATVGGERYEAQRIVDIWNEARMALFEAYRTKLGEGKRLGLEVGEQVVSISNFQFTLASTVSTATKPTGYVRFISLSNASDVPIILLPNSLINTVRLGSMLDYKQSATNMFVFDIGTTFVSYGTVGVNSGASFLTSLSTYKLVYYGITLFTLTDVTNGTSVESFGEKDVPKLLELAEAIAQEQGTAKLNALAMKLIGE